MNLADAIVFIVDDDAAVRDALTLMIAQENIAVRAFESADKFLEVCQTERFGCAIVDVRMPGMDGMQLQEIMAELHIMLPIIFLTGHGDISMSVKAMKAGASDFLTKPITREKLLPVVHSAIAESEKILTEIISHRDARSRIASLTEREHDVLTLAIQGRPNKEIARQLEISHRTVEIHKSKIMHKTGAINLLDLARIAQDGQA